MSHFSNNCVGVLTMSIATQVFCLGQDTHDYPDFAGERMDNHGNLSWKSTVEDMKQVWRYYRGVTNRDQGRNCRVNWEAAGFLTTIPPGETHDESVRVRTEPRRREGEIFYNGGTAAGEAKAEAPAWISNGNGSEHCESRARIAIEVNETLFPIEVTTQSTITKDDDPSRTTVQYQLTIAPYKPTEPYPSTVKTSDNLALLFKECRIVWESIESPIWEKVEPQNFNAGGIDERKYLRLSKDAAIDGQYRFEIKLPTKGFSLPVFQGGSLVFLSLNQDKQFTPIARVSAPAYASKKSE